MADYREFVALTQDGATLAGAYGRYGFVLGTATGDQLSGMWSFFDGRGWFQLEQVREALLSSDEYRARTSH